MIHWYSYWLGLIPGKGWKLNRGTPFKWRKTWGGWGRGATSPAPLSHLTTLQHVYTTLALTICVCLCSQLFVWFQLASQDRQEAVRLPLETPGSANNSTLKKKSPHYFRWSMIPNDKQTCRNNAARTFTGGEKLTLPEHHVSAADLLIKTLPPYLYVWLHSRVSAQRQNLTCPDHKPLKTLLNSDRKYLQLVPGLYD